LLELEGVVHRFGEVAALDGVTLRLARGEVVGLVGRNGAGKTTLVRVAAGLLRPSSGRVALFGLDYRRAELAIRLRLGVMPQDDALLDALTARQYLELVGRLHRLDRAEVERRRDELFDTFEVTARDGALLSELSYGTRKKVALAAALVGHPEILLLDEPFEGLDPIAGATLRDLITELQGRGVGILLSSHQLGEVERLATTVAILDHGRLVASGTLDELRTGAAPVDDLEALFEALVGGRKSARLPWL
jgi:ABC-2 type transport system ATP-binding protein